MFLSYHNVILESTVHLNAVAAYLAADIGMPLPAGGAGSTGKYRVQYHPVTNLYPGDSTAHGRDLAGQLMAHDPGQLNIGPGFVEHVQICAADTHSFHTYLNIGIMDYFRNGQFLDFNLI